MAFLLGSFTSGLFTGASSMMELLKARDEMKQKREERESMKVARDAVNAAMTGDRKTQTATAATAAAASPAAIDTGGDEEETKPTAPVTPVTRTALPDINTPKIDRTPGSPLPYPNTGESSDTTNEAPNTGFPVALPLVDVRASASPDKAPALLPQQAQPAAVPTAAQPTGALPTLPPDYVFGKTQQTGGHWFQDPVSKAWSYQLYPQRPDPNAPQFGGSALPARYLNDTP